MGHFTTPAGHVLIAGHGKIPFHRGLFHGKDVAATLKMLVGEDAAAHDGQVGVGAHEVVGELAHKVQELGKGSPVDLHGHMPAIEHDAMLVIVNVGGVLQPPASPGTWMGMIRRFCRAGWFTRPAYPSFSMHSIQAG